MWSPLQSSKKNMTTPHKFLQFPDLPVKMIHPSYIAVFHNFTVANISFQNLQWRQYLDPAFNYFFEETSQKDVKYIHNN